VENVFFNVISSFITIILTTFLSLLLYEDVISDEANKIRKNLSKLIDNNYELMKGYQLKIRKGFMIIKTLAKLTLSKKFNDNIDKSDLQVFLKARNLSKKSMNVKTDILPRINFCKYYNRINNNEIYFNFEDKISKNYQSKNYVSNLKTHKEIKIVEISSKRSLISNKKKILKNKNEFIRSNRLNSDINKNNIFKNEFQITLNINFQYLTCIKELSERTYVNKYSYSGNRSFTFPGRFIKISCSEFYIIQNQEINVPKISKRVYFKVTIIFLIYFIIIFYLMILIQNIQTKYGNKFFGLCILPFLSTLLIKYLISFNVMMLVTSLILFNFGEYFINNKKLPLPIYFISKIFINPIVLNHYYAIKLYQQLK